MKILNAKGLIRFATSGGFPDKEGYLLKRGDLNKGFQRRWFVLRGNLLFYYEKRGDREPVGVVILEGCSIEVADCEQVDNYAFQIAFSGTATRTYILSADSQENMESWMKALSCASYDYIKQLVGQLDNQLRETVSTGNVKLIQEAERESRIFSRTYSKDSGIGLPSRPSRPTTADRSDPFGGISELLTDSFHSYTSHESAGSVDRSNDPYDSFRDSTSSVSVCLNVSTWQMLGISSFHEMHDEVRKQIREFSAAHGETHESLIGDALLL